MRDTVFGLLRTCPQRCSSLLPTSPPGTPENAYHSKDHYQYQSKNSGWAGRQGPPAVIRFHVFAARPLLIVKYGLKTAGGE